MEVKLAELEPQTGSLILLPQATVRAGGITAEQNLLVTRLQGGYAPKKGELAYIDRLGDEAGLLRVSHVSGDNAIFSCDTLAVEKVLEGDVLLYQKSKMAGLERFAE
ncbi:hypothetical protein GCM10007100_39860 [Roseibacillus persicicus]|uniref:Uncharacterized protein n=2 Tax=Roseibacillus persicicus TaxID=454148 RepID=A0A918WQF7_9BACT|nr:hypothetical protein GCM10007100_39860 [Roseibacillus persicicus]